MRLTGAIARKSFQDLGSAHYSGGNHKIPRAWVVIVDSLMASIFSKAGNSVEMIGEAYLSDKETLNIEYEASMSPARREAFRFAHELASWLDAAIQFEAFDRLILVAPPQALNDMRVALSKRVSSRVVAEINKDLTKLDRKDLQVGLEKIV